MKAGLPETGAKPKKGVASLIEEHSNLVNLDNLLSTNKTPGWYLATVSIVVSKCRKLFIFFSIVGNPFEQHQVNPFQAAKPAKPALNQLLPGSNTTGW
jgi:hypothetical protein